jgi:hypothetical protein
MPIYLQPVQLATRCFLHEVLLWVAVQRLPVASYIDDKERWESDDLADGGYKVELNDTMLTEEETERLGLPIDPDWHWLTTEGVRFSEPSLYEKILAKNDLEPEVRRQFEERLLEAIDSQKTAQNWRLLYQRAVEYPTSKIFVALRSGKINAMGRLLPSIDVDEALQILEAEKRDITEVELTNIPQSFWSLKGIDFESSAAQNETAHYCHISCLTEEILAAFPGEREPISEVERMGDSFILNEGSGIAPKKSNRGRPSYPWEAFHIEAAELIRRNELPTKKEAAIEHFQDWFHRELKVRPSRAAIGERLTPYYDRFMRLKG